MIVNTITNFVTRKYILHISKILYINTQSNSFEKYLHCYIINKIQFVLSCTILHHIISSAWIYRSQIIYVYVCARTCACIRMYARVCVCVRVCVNVSVRMCTCACVSGLDYYKWTAKWIGSLRELVKNNDSISRATNGQLSLSSILILFVS